MFEEKKKIALLIIQQFRRTCLVPYPDQTLKTNFSKTPRQKLKVNIYSYRESLALTEYIFTLNFCRAVFEEISLQSFYYSIVRYGDRSGQTYVRLRLLKRAKFLLY